MTDYDDYCDAAMKDGEPRIQGQYGGCIQLAPLFLVLRPSQHGEEDRELARFDTEQEANDYLDRLPADELIYMPFVEAA